MISYRRATSSDAEAVFDLYRSELMREPRADRVTEYLDEFPSALAYLDQELVGFCYSVDFAPDVLELANLVVKHSHRGLGIGSRLVSMIEETAKSRFAAVILVNSDLYPEVTGGKRPATSFYLKHGYVVAGQTAHTRVFWKLLQ